MEVEYVVSCQLGSRSWKQFSDEVMRLAGDIPLQMIPFPVLSPITGPACISHSVPGYGRIRLGSSAEAGPLLTRCPCDVQVPATLASEKERKSNEFHLNVNMDWLSESCIFAVTGAGQTVWRRGLPPSAFTRKKHRINRKACQTLSDKKVRFSTSDIGLTETR